MQTVFDIIQNWMYNQEIEKENIQREINEQSFVEPMIEATVVEKFRYGTRKTLPTGETPNKNVNSNEVETNIMGSERVENWMCNPE